MRSSQISLALENNQCLAGYRLHRLELLNWGTFQGRHEIKPSGNTVLLTGKNGSGKSTLVDTLLTLLVPNNKRNYNLAAGGSSKRDRNETSYVRGAYGSSKSEEDEKAKPGYLRNDQDYSVLLAYFCRQETGEKVTLAQIFFFKESLTKIFVVATSELTIYDHFSNFADKKEWKQKLKSQKDLGIEYLGDEFAEYSRRFRKIFNLSEKALDLFNQTVSLKEVGKLNDFVRGYMLNKDNTIIDHLGQLRKHYEDIKKCQNELEVARHQIEILQPLSIKDNDYKNLTIEQNDLEECLKFVPVYFAKEAVNLLEQELIIKGKKLQNLANELSEVNLKLEVLKEKQSNLKADIKSQDISQQIREIERDIRDLEMAIRNKKSRAQVYRESAQKLGLSYPSDAEFFAKNQMELSRIKENKETEVIELNGQRDVLVSESTNLNSAIREKESDLQSLKKQKNQIPRKNLELRDRILKSLNIAEVDVPFIGELIKVKDEEKAWEGAIERLLHNFGLSLIVQEKHFQRFSEYVDNHDMKGKVFYYKLPLHESVKPNARISKNSVFYKIDCKTDTPFANWLKNKLIEQYDFTCCEVKDLPNYDHAITKNGLTKRGGQRYEKDDTNKLDITNYILGWTNQAKIDALEVELQELKIKYNQKQKEQQDIEQRIKQIQDHIRSIEKLREFRNFSEIYWLDDEKNRQNSVKLKEDLEKNSNIAQLRQELGKVEEEMKKYQKDHDQLFKDETLTKNNLEQSETRLNKYQKIITDAIPMSENDERTFSQKIQGLKIPITLSNIEDIEDIKQNTEKNFSKALTSINSKINKLTTEMISIMQEFKHEYPQDSTEIDSTIESLQQFLKIYQDLEREGLPSRQHKFNEMVEEYAVNDVALLQDKLEESINDIKGGIYELNQYLKTLQYNQVKQTYIQLEYENNLEREIKDFKVALRSCFPDVGNDHNQDIAVNNLGKLLDKLDSDLSWQAKVIDVRNWLDFIVREKSQIDDKEIDYLQGSSGKSGGQKAKFAYTILASAIAYQYGLQQGEIKPDSFRLVVVDEAFSKLDPDNAKYTMDLFQKLNLQLLLVTPHNQIHTVESYVKSIHFAVNKEGNNSQVLDLTIEAYQTNRKKYDNT